MNDWHRDYIAESIKRYEIDGWRDDPSFDWLSQIAPGCPRLAAHAHATAMESNDAHSAAVAATVQRIAERSMQRGGQLNFSAKQGFVVGRTLAERHGTARALAEALYGLSAQEIDHADV